MRKAIIGVDPKTKVCDLIGTDTPENRSEAEKMGLIIVPSTIEKAREWGFKVVDDVFDLVPILGGAEAMPEQADATRKELETDKKRLDWLADPNNHIGNVQLPVECVQKNLHSLRAAIDCAMGLEPNELLCGDAATKEKT
ncbi:MAG: hypothetical protein ABF271_12835 [Abyssibacter sp.]|uniref:hypothetical protein n=1 Tax=Abyssibacter sp. TaxID=2320200 RepID=UPI003219D6B0